MILLEPGLEGLRLLCSCWYYDQYEFVLLLKRIGSISPRSFTIFGDIIEIDYTCMAKSLKQRLIPKITNNVTLVYNIGNRSMRTIPPINGLEIKPDDNGEDGWSKVLGYVGKKLIEIALKDFDEQQLRLDKIGNK